MKKQKDLKYDNHTKARLGVLEIMRKKDLKMWYWIVFAIAFIIAIVSIAFQQTISFAIFALISFVMAVLNKQIIDIIWLGVK